MTEAKDNQKSGSKKGLIIAFIIILLAINAVQLFLNITKSNDVELKEQQIADQKATIEKADMELAEKIQELETIKMQLAELGGDTARLGEQIRTLTLEKDKLAKSNNYNYSQYMKLKGEIDNARTIANNARAEVERLTAQLAKADSSLKEYKKAVVAKEETISKLEVTKEELSKKVALASVLKAESIKISAISSKNKAKDGEEFKAKTIDKIRVSFFIADNKIARQEGKELILRVIEPDGSALFDATTGGGSFMFEGKEIFYTLKQEILFDNRKKEFAFLYHKGSAYKPGKHTIELYSEGFKIGEASFLVKK